MTPFNKETEEEFNKEFENVRWDSHKGTGDILTFINARVAKRTEDIREAVEEAVSGALLDGQNQAHDVASGNDKNIEERMQNSVKFHVNNALSAINKFNDDAPAS